MKHVFVFNPVAGNTNNSEDLRKKVKQLLDESEYIFYETKAIGDAMIFVKEFLTTHNNEIIRFYACGGDGTLNEVINGSIGFNNAQITNYPIGSANDFLKFFGDPSIFLDIKALINGSEYKTDLLKFNDRYIVNVFNIGYDANVVKNQKKFKKFPLVSAHGAYNLSVVYSLLGKLSHKFKITGDDELLYDGKVTMCAVANSICYGGGYYCAPIAKINDGILDVCVVKKISLFTFAKLAKVYKEGKHLENENVKKYITYKQCKKIRIETDKPMIYSIDGELGESKDMLIEVIPNAITFTVPNSYMENNK